MPLSLESYNKSTDSVESQVNPAPSEAQGSLGIRARCGYPVYRGEPPTTSVAGV